MASPIESLRTQIEAFVEEQLEAYKAELPRRRIGGRLPAASTRIAREKGAEDFALFLLGKVSKSERIRGAIRKRRTK